MTNANSGPKSCLTCPSMLTPQESQLFFGKSLATPICARFGKPIGTMTSDENKRKEIAKAIAAPCDKYGEPRPQSVNWNDASFLVTLPDPTVLQFNSKRDQPTVTNCGMCEHQIRPDVVANEIGFPAALCAARGKLLLPNRMTYEARGCEYRSLVNSGVRTDIGGIMMLPEYSADFSLSTDPVKYHLQQKMLGLPEPEDYPTDKPVSDDERNNGVRAWRRITDPNTENEVYLPIYRLDYFDEAEQKKIPRKGDDEHPEDYVDHNFFIYKIAVLWTELDETPGLWGEAGTGKTELFRHLAYLMCLPFERVSITGSTELDDLAGKMHFSKERGTYWEDGRLVKAWSKPCVLVVDEPNVGPPDVWQFIRPMTDNSKQLVLDQNNGEARQRHTDCYLGLAMNPAWDPKNVGTHEVGDADVNRLMHIFVERPPVAIEKEIIATRCEHDGYQIEAELLDTIIKIAADIRGLTVEGTVPISWAIRPQLKVARASRWFDMLTCYRMAVADFLEPTQAEQVMDVVKSHIE